VQERLNAATSLETETYTVSLSQFCLLLQSSFFIYLK